MKNKYHTFILGGSSGIGLAVAKRQKQADKRVLVASRRATSISDFNDSFDRAVDLDAGDFEAVQVLMNSVEFDHLVVSISMPLIFKDVKSMEEEEACQIFNKYWYYFNAAKSALLSQRQLKSITFISGAIAEKYMPGASMLTVTNSAIHALTKSLATEVAPVRVNVVSPGPTDTPLYDNEENRLAFLEDMKQGLLLKRIGFSCEVASVVELLINNHNITGSIFQVDGGAVLS